MQNKAASMAPSRIIPWGDVYDPWEPQLSSFATNLTKAFCQLGATLCMVLTVLCAISTTTSDALLSIFLHDFQQ
jgi:hypothetical protein